MYTVQQIPFEMIQKYWVEVKHFHTANKVITEQVTQLGPYKSSYEWGKQNTQAYGLFDDDYMIGGTQILEWEHNVIRWRTNNIRIEYRGQGLFYKFLSTIIVNDWSHKDLLIGWFRSSAMWWPPIYGFEMYDGQTYSHDNDTYTLVKKPISSIIDQYKPFKHVVFVK